MRNNKNNLSDLDRNLLYIQDNITMYLTDRGINSGRLYFCELPIFKFDNQSNWITNVNTIDEVYESMSENDKKIGFNINGQFAEYVSNIMLYSDLGIKDYKPFEWKENIKWGFLS